MKKTKTIFHHVINEEQSYLKEHEELLTQERLAVETKEEQSKGVDHD